jgi:L-amino acid N-acyltransferase
MNKSKYNIIIRLAMKDDMAVVADIYNQSIEAGRITADMTPVDVPNRLAWLKKHPRSKYPVFVAEIDGRIVGWLSLSAYRPGREALSQTAEISYYIDFSHHKCGVATALMEHALSLCPQLDIDHLLAIIIEGNNASIYLMKKYGFKEWGWLPGVNCFGNQRLAHLYYGKSLLAEDEPVAPVEEKNLLGNIKHFLHRHSKS